MDKDMDMDKLHRNGLQHTHCLHNLNCYSNLCLGIFVQLNSAELHHRDKLLALLQQCTKPPLSETKSENSCNEKKLVLPYSTQRGINNVLTFMLILRLFL